MKNDIAKPISLQNLKDYTAELLDKLFPVGHLVLTKVAPDKQGFPFIAHLIPDSDWLPLEENRMLRIMSTLDMGGGDTCVLTDSQCRAHSHSMANLRKDGYYELMTGIGTTGYDPEHRQGKVQAPIGQTDIMWNGAVSRTSAYQFGSFDAISSFTKDAASHTIAAPNEPHSTLNAYQGIYGWERIARE